MNTTAKWHCQTPLSTIVASDQLDAVLSCFFQPTQYQLHATKIPLDVREDSAQYFVEATIPGVKKEDIKLTVDKGDVTIVVESRRTEETPTNARTLLAERSLGKSSRSFSLAHEIDEAHIEARYTNGVLHLKLPKRITASAKQITIN